MLRIVWSGFRQLRKVRKGASRRLPSAVRLAEGRDRRLRKVGEDARLALVSRVRLRTCILRLLLEFRRSVDCRSPSSLCFAGVSFVCCRISRSCRSSVTSFAPHCCAHCGLFFRAVGGRPRSLAYFEKRAIGSLPSDREVVGRHSPSSLFFALRRSLRASHTLCVDEHIFRRARLSSCVIACMKP